MSTYNPVGALEKERWDKQMSHTDRDGGVKWLV